MSVPALHAAWPTNFQLGDLGLVNVNENENHFPDGLVRQGSVRVVEAVVLLEVMCVQGEVGAMMKVGQISRENLVDAQLIFSFQVQNILLSLGFQVRDASLSISLRYFILHLCSISF